MATPPPAPDLNLALLSDEEFESFKQLCNKLCVEETCNRAGEQVAVISPASFHAEKDPNSAILSTSNGCVTVRFPEVLL
jgi:hypothetical protein